MSMSSSTKDNVRWWIQVVAMPLILALLGWVGWTVKSFQTDLGTLKTDVAVLKPLTSRIDALQTAIASANQAAGKLDAFQDHLNRLDDRLFTLNRAAGWKDRDNATSVPIIP